LQNSKNTLRPFGKLSAQGKRYFDYSVGGEPIEPRLILLRM